MATVNEAFGSHTSLTITNLNSLASSATAGWQSVRIDNTSTKALDYEIAIKLDMANTAPANDKAVYVFASVAYYDGSSWYQSDGGTTTLPSGSEGTYTIGGVTTTNNLVQLGRLAYTAQDQIIQGVFFLSNAVGRSMPDGFSIIIVNYSGAAVASSGNMVAYKAITETVA